MFTTTLLRKPWSEKTMLVVAVTLLAMATLVSTASAQAERGAVSDLTLASAEPGKLKISWSTSDPAPTDYRLMWAEDSLGFPSWRDANESQRGNDYPEGNLTEHTLPSTRWTS